MYLEQIQNISLIDLRILFAGFLHNLLNLSLSNIKGHQKGSSLIQSINNIAIYEPRSVCGMNYCEIRCKYDDDFNTAHVMIDQNWNDFLNYQMIQSVNVLTDCVKECAILNMDDVMYIINDNCLN